MIKLDFMEDAIDLTLVIQYLEEHLTSYWNTIQYQSKIFRDLMENSKDPYVQVKLKKIFTPSKKTDAETI
jgi:hypothetical protein